MKIYKTTVLMLGILIFFTACVTPATPPAKLKPYPFTQNISNISCEKLTARLIDLQKNNESLYPTQESLAKKDNDLFIGAIVGSIFLFPPHSLSEHITGDRITALAIQRNKGEINAIKRELDSERCN